SGFGSGGGLFSGFGSVVKFANNVFATNTGGSIQRFGDNPVSQGHNLSIDAAGGDGSTGPGGFLNGPGDIRNTNPMLDALGNFGGRTPTCALLPGSPAINMGDDALAPTRDQRGYGRAGTSDIGAFEFAGVQQGVPLASIVSRKTHGSAGQFDINLPVTGNVGVECRSGGGSGNNFIIFTFANPLVSLGGVAISGGTGNVSSAAISSDTHQVFVNLSNVANEQTLTLRLTNITDTVGNQTGTLAVGVGFLFGDSNGDRVVNSGDATQVRNRSGQPVSATNFRSEFNLDGIINSGDATVVRSRSGQFIP
ncbi:MAG TPA: choice-of-anchor Q domain-containing protein, partial [Chthoniobacterales bacterium]